MDGSEDNEIHCFKPDGPVPTGRDLLKQARTEKKIIEFYGRNRSSRRREQQRL